MKYNLNVVLVDGDDKPIPSAVGDSSPATLGLSFANSLMFDSQENQDSKEVRYALWLRVKSARKTGEITLSVPEVSLIRKQVLAAYPTLVAGQVCHILDQKDPT